MSKESQLFLKGIHLSLFDTLNSPEHTMFGSDVTSNDLLGGNLEYKDVDVLRTIELNGEQHKALKKLFLAISRSSAVDVLAIIDGIVMSDKLGFPDLSLVDRETRKDIADEAPLNEEFFYFLED